MTLFLHLRQRTIQRLMCQSERRSPILFGLSEDDDPAISPGLNEMNNPLVCRAQTEPFGMGTDVAQFTCKVRDPA